MTLADTVTALSSTVKLKVTGAKSSPTVKIFS
ncbi:hypothetical protein DSM104299_02680 [Baekduia alba]|nr:hypothetical protein DSM104299_02680 [Baekduia alba]